MSVVIGIVGLVVVAILGLEIVAAVRSGAAAKWRSTLGKLKNWSMAYDEDGEGTYLVLRHLTYVYHVNGKDYESSVVGFGFPARISVLYIDKHLQEILRSAPQVTVYYDQHRPARSVLSVGVQAHHLIKIAALAFILVFIGVFYTEL